MTTGTTFQNWNLKHLHFKKNLPNKQKNPLARVHRYLKVFILSFLQQKETSKLTNQHSKFASIPRYETQRVESRVSHTSPATKKAVRNELAQHEALGREELRLYLHIKRYQYNMYVCIYIYVNIYIYVYIIYVYVQYIHIY